MNRARDEQQRARWIRGPRTGWLSGAILCIATLGAACGPASANHAVGEGGEPVIKGRRPKPPPTLSAFGGPLVLTQHNDNARSGTNLMETELTTESVTSGSFGKLFSMEVDGDVYAQPLYVSDTATPFGQHNVVYVATEHNSVYAFDADDQVLVSKDGAVVPYYWKSELGESVPIPTPDFGNSPIMCKVWKEQRGKPFTEATPDEIRSDPRHLGYNMRESGITSTPVIDLASHTIYVVSFSPDGDLTNPNGTCYDGDCKEKTPCTVRLYKHELHALDMATGKERNGSPVRIEASVPGTAAGSRDGMLTFDSSLQLQRAGLLLSNGVLYIGFGSYSDQNDAYRGWLLAYDAPSLKQIAAYVDAPEVDAEFHANGWGEQGGIWQSGQGPAADPDGNVYVMTGNGSFTAHKGGANLADSFVKLTLARTPILDKPGAAPVPAPGTFKVTDWFAPYFNDLAGCSPSRNCLFDWDADLGSSGPLVIPGTSYVTGGGKQGILYLLDRAHMGGFNDKADKVVQSFRATWVQNPTCHPDLVGKDGTVDVSRLPDSNIHGSPVAWDTPDGTTVYVWGEEDRLKAYRMTDGRFPEPTTNDPSCRDASEIPCGRPTATSPDFAACGMPGAILSISANRSTPGSGIVWATRPTRDDAVQAIVAGRLSAYDASDVSKKLWDSNDDPADAVGYFAKFNAPTIANGKVYIGTFSGRINVYGLF